MFLENVKHILKVSNGKVFEYIKKELEKINYKLQIFNLSPHKFNIPQQRERIFFICVRNDIELYYKNKDLTIDNIIDNNDYYLNLHIYKIIYLNIQLLTFELEFQMQIYFHFLLVVFFYKFYEIL